jgi:hypothetical protein
MDMGSGGRDATQPEIGVEGSGCGDDRMPTVVTAVRLSGLSSVGRSTRRVWRSMADRTGPPPTDIGPASRGPNGSPRPGNATRITDTGSGAIGLQDGRPQDVSPDEEGGCNRVEVPRSWQADE